MSDAFVMGGGVAGLSVALALSERGMKVTLADRGQQEGMSSWAGAGILAPLPPWDYPEEVTRLALSGMATWPDWAARLESMSTISPEYWACGMEVRTETDPDKAGAWCKAHALPVETRNQTIWLPTVAQARNPRLLAAMKEALIAVGGKILPDCEATGLNFKDGQVTSVMTRCGAFSAGQYVLATGAWSGLPLGSLPPLPAIRPIRGQIVLYPPGSHALRHIILQDGVYLVPRLDGHLLVGSTLEDAGFEVRTQPETLETLMQAACRMLPSLTHHAPLKSWAGLRPGSPDNIPLMDRHPDASNLWLNLGHYRYGVTMAPASATLLADLMEAKQPSLDPLPYSWAAFNERSWTAANSPDTSC